MSRLEHTPGPWRYKQVEFSVSVRPAFEITGQSSSWIAHTPYYFENEANARLIAASPDLLSSLKKMTEMARHAPLTGHDYDGCDIDEARAVIAKAEGKS